MICNTFTQWQKLVCFTQRLYLSPPKVFLPHVPVGHPTRWSLPLLFRFSDHNKTRRKNLHHCSNWSQRLVKPVYIDFTECQRLLNPQQPILLRQQQYQYQLAAQCVLHTFKFSIELLQKDFTIKTFLIRNTHLEIWERVSFPSKYFGFASIMCGLRRDGAGTNWKFLLLAAH